VTAIAFSYVAMPEKCRFPLVGPGAELSIITVLLLSPKETLQPLLRSISVAALSDFQSSIVKDFDWKK